jgi:hypothetical protein
MRFRLLVTAFTCVVLAACQWNAPDATHSQPNHPRQRNAKFIEQKASAVPHLTTLDPILVALHSGEERVRVAANSDLFRLHLEVDDPSLADGLKALRAAAQPYPFEKPAADEVSENLVHFAAGSPKPEYVSVVVELFEQFIGRGKWWALSILAQLEDREAALAYMEVVRQHARAGRISGLVIGPLQKKPRHADVFFPELLSYAPDAPNLAPDIYRLCLAYSDAGLITHDALEPYAGQVIAAYRTLAAKLQPAQQDHGLAWMWDEPYLEWRIDGGLLLDLLGYFPPASVEDDLMRAVEYRDPRLQYFAVVSLLRMGKPVDVERVAQVAAHAEMRKWLYDELHRLGQVALYPEKYRTQAALAESDMVHWLTYPTELGRVPDEIELMKVVPVDTGLPGGIYDYFLFRFRTHEPHWSAKDGWMAGVSGPFRRTDEPTTAALGDTFSTFKKWDSTTPEEQVGNIRELMKRWREYHADEHK